MNKIIGLKELRENMDTYISHVEKGKSFTVVRKSKPVFKIMPVDEWGDEGVWESVDLRDKNGRGMEASKLLKELKEINEQIRKVSKKTAR
jgi:prevent-host-death family protein